MAKKLSAYLRHLETVQDLVTTPENTRGGFIALALERNRRATPFVAEARDLKVNASEVATPARLLKRRQIQAALLTAAGVSDKAAGHFQDSDKLVAIENLITEFLEPAGDAFVEELVFRFLLTRGDTLGGSMRNVGGVLAQRKFARAVMASLTNCGHDFLWLHRETGLWAEVPTTGTAGLESDLRGLAWGKKTSSRVLVYNLNVPAVRNNVDLSLLNSAPDTYLEAARKSARYIALGELKGGIDPAGADEHWKTANTALSRIRNSFADASRFPSVFYVGAAIARKMALQIWSQLEGGTLANAANLTSDDQVASLCSWLCSL
jgi:hypothetical protein